MLKFVALPLFFIAVNAGLLGVPALGPIAYSAPVVAAPVAVKAAIPVATSYQNTYKIATGAVAVAAPVAPIVKTASLVAAPVVTAHAAPFAVATPVVHSVAAGPIYKAGPIW